MKRLTMILVGAFFVFLAFSCATTSNYQDAPAPIYEVETVDPGPIIEYITGMGTTSEPDYSGHTFTAYIHIEFRL